MSRITYSRSTVLVRIIAGTLNAFELMLKGKWYLARTRISSILDAVLLDIGLPKVSGWEVFLQMKREQPSLRAVIASGYLEPDLQNNMKNAGISHVINKPYMPDEVSKVLEDLMSTEKS